MGCPERLWNLCLWRFWKLGSTSYLCLVQSSLSHGPLQVTKWIVQPRPLYDSTESTSTLILLPLLKWQLRVALEVTLSCLSIRHHHRPVRPSFPGSFTLRTSDFSDLSARSFLTCSHFLSSSSIAPFPLLCWPMDSPKKWGIVTWYGLLPWHHIKGNNIARAVTIFCAVFRVSCLTGCPKYGISPFNSEVSWEI